MNNKIRADFPMLKQDIIYFDNGATTFKPFSVIEKVVDYYSNYTANAYRGDYDNSLKVDYLLEQTRGKVKAFINANHQNEVVFTTSATEALNMIISGFLKYHLKSNDEVLITKSEHASLVLPLFLLSEQIGFKIKYIDLNEHLEVTMSNLKRAITNNTKVIALSHITNVIGDIRPIKEIASYAHQKGIWVIVDGAQSVPHLKVDVKYLDIDFLVFSAHKMLGPTGVGVLYGKYNLLNQLKPLNVGGGMNTSFTSLKEVKLKEVPHCLEAGTPNIEGIIGFGAAIDYLNNIGIDNITIHERKLKEYAVLKLSKLDNIELYNPFTKAGVIAFNVKDVFSQDTAIYLNKHKICIRAGNHCAKLLKEELGINNTCRISFYLYNTKKEIDKLISVLEGKDILRESL